MKILHYYIITIFATSLVVVSNPVFADDSTSYGGLIGYRQAYFQGNHGSYPIWYKIINGTVVGTPLDLPAKALLFEINTTSNGQLTVELPRTIIDSKNGSDDVPYFASVYNIRSLGGPMKITPKEINNNDMRILKINFTKNITEIEIAGTFFIEKYHYVAPNLISSLSPLKQYESGLAANDVKCGQGLQLVIKTKDGSPACVKPNTATKLIERGWTKMRFATGITINSYTPTSNDTTYLSQTVDEWKNKTYDQLDAYYKKYKDAFYDELGSFLIKDEMKKELARQNIQNVHDDFKVFPGMSLDSLPPHISYDAVVNATDGNSYLLLGSVFANKIESSPKIIKLVFDKNALHSLGTGSGPSYPDPSTNAHVDNSTSQERVQIAGTHIENSDIPWSSVGTGNYGVIQIGLYTSVYHMIPDAQKYYTARAMQLIPFYVPVKILPPPFTAK